MTTETQDAEVFIRYIKAEQIYEAKLGTENAPAMQFPEDKVTSIMSVMTPVMADLFTLLIREAKKDAEGKWVSASTKAMGKGQAVLTR
jgi:hypothetical protein